MNKKNNSNKNNGWKRIAAGALSMALVAGALPANVGGILTTGSGIVAHADGVNVTTLEMGEVLTAGTTLVGVEA